MSVLLLQIVTTRMASSDSEFSELVSKISFITLCIFSFPDFVKHMKPILKYFLGPWRKFCCVYWHRVLSNFKTLECNWIPVSKQNRQIWLYVSFLVRDQKDALECSPSIVWGSCYHCVILWTSFWSPIFCLN